MVFVVFCLELKFSSRHEHQERLILHNLRDLYTGWSKKTPRAKKRPLVCQISIFRPKNLVIYSLDNFKTITEIFSHYLEISRKAALLKNHAILKSLHFSSFWAYACVINMPLAHFNLKLATFDDTFGY